MLTNQLIILITIHKYSFIKLNNMDQLSNNNMVGWLIKVVKRGKEMHLHFSTIKILNQWHKLELMAANLKTDMKGKRIIIKTIYGISNNSKFPVSKLKKCKKYVVSNWNSRGFHLNLCRQWARCYLKLHQ